jgi:hypothetical protein
MQRFWPASNARKISLRPFPRDWHYPVAAAIWFMLVAIGLGTLMNYANRPGEQGDAPTLWPVNRFVTRSDSKPTLLVFAHPKCPCTRATLNELSWLMTRCHDKVECHVMFFHPDGEDVDWIKTDSWNSADSIDGVHVNSDPHSRLATVFGVRTSGHALLYEPNGHLLFEGGITLARGHRGANPGRTALLALIRRDGSNVRSKEADAVPESPCVFGCPLHSPDAPVRRSPGVSEG